MPTVVAACPTLHRRCRWLPAALGALLLMLAPLPVALAAQSRSNFDHLTTGFELLGQHRNLPCEACHANAIFKGTPTQCGACHGIGTAIRATAKPANHILSTDQCQSCHTPWAFNPAVDFDHTQALGSCSTCHNGVNATGMPATHIPIDTPPGAPTPCEGCHSTTQFTTWAGTVINHASVTAMQCQTCHQTAAYLGMTPSTNTKAGDSRPNATLDANHPTSGDCGQCHTTVSFAASVSRPANHIPTSAPCVQCHTTGNDAQYSVTGTHQGVTGCLSCHGTGVGPFANITIVTAPANHFP